MRPLLAGKSTLLNRLTNAGVLAEDKLFATLDPTTRRVELAGGKELLVTDTVGFIQKLPTQVGRRAARRALRLVVFAGGGRLAGRLAGLVGRSLAPRASIHA